MATESKATGEKTVCAVVGAGYMGGGIAQVLALHDHEVYLADVDADTAEKSRQRLVKQAEGFEKRELMPAGAAKTIDQNLHAAKSIEAAVSDAEYITEAVPEVPKIKEETLNRITDAAPADAVIGSNTSALPIHQLAASIKHPERFLGVHWMNPAPFIPGVELVAGPDTSKETVARAERIVRAAGKNPAPVADTPGFVANRLQFALYKEAAQMVDEGTARPEEIDTVVSNSFGFRLALFGPFAIGDMAGLDVYESSYQTLEKAFGDRFAVPQLLSDAVSAGNLGVKSGHGVLDIADDEQEALAEFRDKAYALLSQLRSRLGKAPGLSE